MSIVTLGEISSVPDENGNHKLKCPNCQTDFLSPISRDEDTQELESVTCKKCSHSDKPLVFLHQAHKQEADAMAHEYAMREIKKSIGKIRF